MVVLLERFSFLCYYKILLMKKTNAMRFLDKLNIFYETLEYDCDKEHELSRGVALDIADKLGLNPEAVFKTIVFEDEKHNLAVFCQRACKEINLKKARNVTGANNITPLSSKDLLAKTGYIRGGVSPIAMKKNLPTFIDSSAKEYDKIYISAGQKGLQIVIAPEALATATNAQFVDITL